MATKKREQNVDSYLLFSIGCTALVASASSDEDDQSSESDGGVVMNSLDSVDGGDTMENSKKQRQDDGYSKQQGRISVKLLVGNTLGLKLHDVAERIGGNKSTTTLRRGWTMVACEQRRGLVSTRWQDFGEAVIFPTTIGLLRLLSKTSAIACKTLAMALSSKRRARASSASGSNQTLLRGDNSKQQRQ